MGVFEVARYCPVKPRKATIARRPFLISRSFMASNPGPLQRRMNKVNVMPVCSKGVHHMLPCDGQAQAGRTPSKPSGYVTGSKSSTA